MQYVGLVDSSETVETDHGYDRSGSDLPNMPITAASVHACSYQCGLDARCKSFAFDTCGTACWLKSDVPNPTFRSCRVSL